MELRVGLAGLGVGGAEGVVWWGGEGCCEDLRDEGLEGAALAA